MGQIKIEIKNDFRKLKKGDIYEFGECNNTIIAGDNGSGKSSLFNALRGGYNSLPEIYGSSFPVDYKELSENIIVEHNYEKIFFFNIIDDNAFNINTGHSATSFCEAGGLHIRNTSHGETSCIYFNIFLDKIKKNYIPNKTLIVIDELDNGYDISSQTTFNKIINALNINYKLDIITISHNIFTMIETGIVYDFSKRELVLSKNYIIEKTGYKLTKTK